MKQGRPPNDIDWEDRDIIPLKLSFNQIKYLLKKFRNHRTDSMEGTITEKLLHHFRLFLERKANNNELPQKLIKLLTEEDTTNEKTDIDSNND